MNELVTRPEPVPIFNGDLYSHLGITNKATLEEIVFAYRRLAMKYHPDRSSDPKAGFEFQAVQQAYVALSNPKTRSFYDRTGVLPLTEVEIEKNASTVATQRILFVVDDITSLADKVKIEVLMHIDPVDHAVKTLVNDLSSNAETFKKTSVVVNKLKLVNKRFTKKNPNFSKTLVGCELLRKLNEARANLGALENDKAVIKMAIEYAKKYDYEAEPLPPKQPPQPTTRVFINPNGNGFFSQNFNTGT